MMLKWKIGRVTEREKETDRDSATKANTGKPQHEIPSIACRERRGFRAYTNYAITPLEH